MEEESCDVHSEENKDSSEKNKKRKLKTPSQVIALENFYNEHKYPTEEMKSQLADHLGLTEKQISGWFCHRRLKDKRLLRDEARGNVRQDRSSGVIQDRGSGLGQDSCGSTKHGDFWHADPREVESRGPYGHDFPTADLSYEHRNMFGENNIRGMDNTSSESSSSLQDRSLSQSEHPYDRESSRYLTHNGVVLPKNSKVSKITGYKPSGYLKVKGEVENAAITAVKRQLGMQYREDGPPLGVEFQPLPPGAFESSVEDPVRGEPCYVGNNIVPCSPDISMGKKQNSLGSGYEVHNLKLSSHGPNTDIPTNAISGPKSHHPLNKNLNPPGRPFPGHNSSLDLLDESAGETLLYNSSRNHRTSSNNHPVDRTRSDSISNHYGRKKASEQTESRLHNHSNVDSKNVRRSGYLKPNQSNLIHSRSESFDTEEGRISARMKRDEISYGEKKAVKMSRHAVRVKSHANDMKVSKHMRADFPQRDYLTKEPFSEMPERINQIKRSTVEMPASFSEYEMAETSSSMD